MTVLKMVLATEANISGTGRGLCMTDVKFYVVHKLQSYLQTDRNRFAGSASVATLLILVNFGVSKVWLGH